MPSYSERSRATQGSSANAHRGTETPAHAVTETATKTRMHKAGASEPRMEEARVTKPEASELWTEKPRRNPQFQHFFEIAKVVMVRRLAGEANETRTSGP